MALKIEQNSSKSKDVCVLVIDEDLTIYVIDTLKQAISKELDRYSQFELNLAGVDEIDSAGIQLLLALRRELVQKQKKFILTSMSASVDKLLKSYGLLTYLTEGAAA